MILHLLKDINKDKLGLSLAKLSSFWVLDFNLIFCRFIFSIFGLVMGKFDFLGLIEWILFLIFASVFGFKHFDW